MSPTVWHTVIAEGNDTVQTVSGIGGRLYAVYSHAASHRTVKAGTRESRRRTLAPPLPR